MKKAEQQVRDFMEMAEQDVPLVPTMVDFKTRRLRYLLIKEELSELLEAFALQDVSFANEIRADRVCDLECEDNQKPSLVKAADALADLAYVVIGGFVALGIDTQVIWDMVHESNMAKMEGGYKNEVGKWIKPEDWQPPDIESALRRMSCSVAHHSLTAWCKFCKTGKEESSWSADWFQNSKLS